MKAFVQKDHDLIFLSGMSILGVAFMFYVTSTYGPGIPTDSAWYLSAAESVLQGRGLFTFDTSPLNAFPPLYTFLIAALSGIFDADVVMVGWYLNGFFLGVNIFLSGLLLKEVFSSWRVFFYMAVLVIVSSASFMRMHASLLTEPLFLTILLLSIFVARSYFINRDWKSLVLLALLAALAPLLRFVGMSFILSGLAVILWVHGRDWRSLIKRGFLFGLTAGLPFTLWAYFHNYLLYGAFLYPGIPRDPDFWVNFAQAIRKIFYWFVPYRPFTKDGIAEALAAFSSLVIILIILNRKSRWFEWVRRFTEPLPFLSVLYAGLYFLALTATANTPDHYSLISDRYYAAILFFVLLVLFISIEKLVLPNRPFSSRIVRFGLLCLFVVWMSIPVSRMMEYAQKSRANGEDGYNLYNTRQFHESELIARAQVIARESPDAHLYSNIPAAVWLFTRRTMDSLPDKYQRWTKDEYKQKMAGWPYDKPGYVIWFTSDPFEIFYSPLDLYLIADIHPVYEAADGTIYYVSKRE